jgi:hypothetical protein
VTVQVTNHIAKSKVRAGGRVDGTGRQFVREDGQDGEVRVAATRAPVKTIQNGPSGDAVRDADIQTEHTALLPLIVLESYRISVRVESAEEVGAASRGYESVEGRIPVGSRREVYRRQDVVGEGGAVDDVVQH